MKEVLVDRIYKRKQVSDTHAIKTEVNPKHTKDTSKVHWRQT